MRAVVRTSMQKHMVLLYMYMHSAVSTVDGCGFNSSGHPCHHSQLLQLPQKISSLSSWWLVHGVTFGQGKPSFVTKMMKLLLVWSTPALNLKSKEQHLSHMMRCLFFIEAKFNFILTVRHIPGKSNIDADNLLRGGAHHILSPHPQANNVTTPIKPGLIKCLISVAPD